MNTRLYKAERLNGGSVVKGYYCKVGETITGEASPEGVKHFIIPVGTTSLEGAVEIDVKTLAQYTGIKDKNGKEICQYNECKLTVDSKVTHPHIPVSRVITRGYIDFINGCYVFVEYIHRTIVELHNLNLKGMKIEVIADKYNEKLAEARVDCEDGFVTY